ncbi:hypothetical protein ACFQZ4_03315 [Catellatospora coxensis]
MHDLRDGRLLRTGRVAFPPGSPEMAAVYGGMLVLSARLPTGQYLETRYDTRTLRELSVTSSPLRFPCGGHLCEVGDVGGVRTPLAVLDRDTLAVRHRLEPNMNLLPSAQGAITVQMAGEGSLGANADRLIDLADGTTLLDLTGWGAQLAFDGSLDALLMRRVPDGVQVARIEDGRVRLLGTLPASLQRCFHTRQRIACVRRRPAGRLERRRDCLSQHFRCAVAPGGGARCRRSSRSSRVPRCHPLCPDGTVPV